MDFMQEPEQVRITQLISTALVGLFAAIFAVVYTMSHLREVVSIATGLFSIAALIAVVFYTQKIGESLHTRKESQ